MQAHDTRLESEPFYSILYARDFNPNNTEYFVFARKFRKEKLPAFLIELSKIYFRQLDEKGYSHNLSSVKNGDMQHVSSYQCSRCMTIYDKKYGDPDGRIKPGTPFNTLPSTYTCPVCGNEKQSYNPVTEY